jgi:hypothetical protein
MKLPQFTAGIAVGRTGDQYLASFSYNNIPDKRVLPQSELVCNPSVGCRICCGIHSDELGMSIPIGCFESEEC